MPFPTNGSWPPPRCAGVRSLRVYAAGTLASGSAFADDPNHFLFALLDTDYVDTGDPLLTSQFGDYLKPGPPFGGSQGQGPGAQINNVEKPPPPAVHSQYIRITNLNALDSGEDLEFSFDGTNVHGYVPAGESRVYDDRREAGIALRPVAAADTNFILEAW